jgi:hypothetical protein
LLTDGGLRRDFSLAARAAAEQRFSLQTTVAQMRALYLSLLEQAQARSASAKR